MRTYQEILRFCVDWEQGTQDVQSLREQGVQGQVGLSKLPVIRLPEQESIRERLQTLCHGMVQTDSRSVSPGDLFIAVRGIALDGHAFTEQAAERGATVIITEADPTWSGAEYLGPEDAIHVQVSSTRRLAGPLAQYVLGNPATSMTVIGVTGTNGKTTTATLIEQLLSECGAVTTLLGTIEKRFPDEIIQSRLTTTGPAELAADFARARRENSDVLVMEVSSHALDQHRTDGIAFDAAVFTNLTQDHLDYHGTMEQYARAKRRLFDNLPEDARAYFFRDDAYAGFMAEQCRATSVLYGFEEGADRQATGVELSVSGSRFDLAGIPFETRLVGRHNVVNMMAALSVCMDMGVEQEALQHASAKVKGPRGRLERVLPSNDDNTGKAEDTGNAKDTCNAEDTGLTNSADNRSFPVVFVDYAHTPDALQHVCDTLRAVMPPSCQLHVVFGCGGDRDRGKRPQMGHIAEQSADRVTITSDNPRSEDPMAIIGDVLAGCSDPDRIDVEADRRKAIRKVVMGASVGDVVLIAGKGHETTQEMAGVRTHLDDTEEAREALQARETQQAHEELQARGASPINPKEKNGEVA